MQLSRLSKYLCYLSAVVVASVASSTPVCAEANGSEPLKQVKWAQTLVNSANTHNVCSSTFITNSTLLADCRADITDLTTTISAWTDKFESGTLTNAFDVTTENDLASEETNLKTVLNDAGFSFSASTSIHSLDSGSLAFGISSDVIQPEPESSMVCVLCAAAAAAQFPSCEAAATPPGAVLCVAAIALSFVACTFNDCILPPEPPELCSLIEEGVPNDVELLAASAVVPMRRDHHLRT